MTPANRGGGILLDSRFRRVSIQRPPKVTTFLQDLTPSGWGGRIWNPESGIRHLGG
jgi:hypothetical protein